jgi:hypothetical protein
MQRWIIAGALVLFLLGGGGIFAYWKIRQQQPDFQYIPLPYHPTSTAEQRANSEKQMRERLLTDAILTGVVRDCNIVSKWGLPSESAAVEELRRRAIIESKSDKINDIETETLRIGFNGVVAEHQQLRDLSQRLMEDVQRLIQQDQGKGTSPAPAPAGAGAGGSQNF